MSRNLRLYLSDILTSIGNTRFISHHNRRSPYRLSRLETDIYNEDFRKSNSNLDNLLINTH
ncbi:MAG: hypothetical protein AAFY63_14720 [Cyanobacteria bacterium J06643_13]